MLRLWGFVAFAAAVAGASGKDTGKYVVQSEREFEDVCDKALNCLASEPAIRALGKDLVAVNEHYLKIIRETEWAKGVFKLGSFRIQRAYLALKKLLKYCLSGEFNKIGAATVKDGRHDENSPVLGVKAELFDQYSKFTEKNGALIRFGNALYFGNAACPAENSESHYPPALFKMISFAQRDMATKLANDKMNSYLKTYGLKPGQAYSESSFRAGVTMIADIDNPWNDWNAQAYVDPAGINVADKSEYFVPASLVAIHELGHVERTMPGSPDVGMVPTHESCKGEIGPTLEMLVSSDEIHKEINGIKIEAEASYSASVPTSTGSLSLGQIANTFRPLIKKHGSVEQALMSKEGLAFVKQHYSNDTCLAK